MRREILADGVELFMGDMLKVLPTLGEFDACVTDPPYGIGIARRGTVGTSKNAEVRDYGKSDWDDVPASSEQISIIRSQSRLQIIFGGNFFELPPTSCWLVWDKQNTGDFADCELAWTNLPKAVRRIYWRWNGMIRKGDDVREHPTQKPEGVMEWCIDQLPADVATIIDPFMGSGTTGVAAVKKGKQFTGIEKRQDYFDIACRRIEDALKRPDLFIPSPPPKPKQDAMPGFLDDDVKPRKRR
jgi:site-specific DNA-methyltransferase (adenine-specific)/modification methylase